MTRSLYAHTYILTSSGQAGSYYINEWAIHICYIHMLSHIDIYAHIHTRAHAHTHTQKHTHTHTHTHTHIFTHTNIHMHTQTQTYIHTHIYSHTHIFTHTNTHKHTNTLGALITTCTHTHTHKQFIVQFMHLLLSSLLSHNHLLSHEDIATGLVLQHTHTSITIHALINIIIITLPLTITLL